MTKMLLKIFFPVLYYSIAFSVVFGSSNSGENENSTVIFYKKFAYEVPEPETIIESSDSIKPDDYAVILAKSKTLNLELAENEFSQRQKLTTFA